MNNYFAQKSANWTRLGGGNSFLLHSVSEGTLEGQGHLAILEGQGLEAAELRSLTGLMPGLQRLRHKGLVPLGFWGISLFLFLYLISPAWCHLHQSSQMAYIPGAHKSWEREKETGSQFPRSHLLNEQCQQHVAKAESGLIKANRVC